MILKSTMVKKFLIDFYEQRLDLNKLTEQFY